MRFGKKHAAKAREEPVEWFVANALENVRAAANARAINLRSELPDPSLTATVDQIGIIDVLTEVLRNAPCPTAVWTWTNTAYKDGVSPWASCMWTGKSRGAGSRT